MKKLPHCVIISLVMHFKRLLLLFPRASSDARLVTLIKEIQELKDAAVAEMDKHLEEMNMLKRYITLEIDPFPLVFTHLSHFQVDGSRPS